MIDYYTVWEVMPLASDEVIKSAYKVLGKKYHPDNQKYSVEFCQKKMVEINVAYEVLSHPQKRKEYDAPAYYAGVFFYSENSGCGL